MSNKKTIPRKVWWGLEAKSYSEIAQELPTNDESLRSWVAIYAVYHLNFADRYPENAITNFWKIQKTQNLSQ
jgi:hypothetical protein